MHKSAGDQGSQAGLRSGYWKDLAEIRLNVCAEKIFAPAMDENERLTLLNGWKKAVNRALG